MKVIFVLMFCLFFISPVNSQPKGKRKKILCGLGFIHNAHETGGSVTFEYFVRKKISIGLLNMLSEANSSSAAYQIFQNGRFSNYSSSSITGYNFSSGLTATFYVPVPCYDRYRFYLGAGLIYNMHKSGNSVTVTSPDYSCTVKYSWQNLAAAFVPGGHYKLKQGMIVFELPFLFSLKEKEKIKFSNAVPNQKIPDRSAALLGIDVLYFKIGYGYEF